MFALIKRSVTPKCATGVLPTKSSLGAGAHWKTFRSSFVTVTLGSVQTCLALVGKGLPDPEIPGPSVVGVQIPLSLVCASTVGPHRVLGSSLYLSLPTSPSGPGRPARLQPPPQASCVTRVSLARGLLSPLPPTTPHTWSLWNPRYVCHTQGAALAPSGKQTSLRIAEMVLRVSEVRDCFLPGRRSL